MDSTQQGWVSDKDIMWRLSVGEYRALVHPAQQFAGYWTASIFGPDGYEHATVTMTRERAQQWCEIQLLLLGLPVSGRHQRHP